MGVPIHEFRQWEIYCEDKTLYKAYEKGRTVERSRFKDALKEAESKIFSLEESRKSLLIANEAQRNEIQSMKNRIESLEGIPLYARPAENYWKRRRESKTR